MRRHAARLRNFYDEDEEDSAAVAPRAGRVASAADHNDGDVEPSPQPYAAIQPTARHPTQLRAPGPSVDPLSKAERKKSLPSSCGSSGSRSTNSSASIEDVISWSAAPVPAHNATRPSHATANLPYNDDNDADYVSLQQLEAAVEEAKRDVRRLRALMVKAVWHALTQPMGERQQQSQSQQQPVEAMRGAKGVMGRTPASGNQRQALMRTSGQLPHSADGSGRLTAPAWTSLSALADDTTGFFNEKPFLPPDRYPTLPPLTDHTDHFHVNLSRALSAAQRAGLLEKQRAWLRQRQPSSSTVPSQGAETASAPPSAVPSARQTALQRISRLFTAPSSGATKTSSAVKGRSEFNQRGLRKVGGELPPSSAASPSPAEVREAFYAGKEAAVQSSLSLVVLRVAKDRAVATLFLRQLRLDTYRRHALHENVALRYAYYLQRRVLRYWCAVAQRQHLWHRELAIHVITHWQRYMRERRAVHQRLREWRLQLRQRAAAFAAVRRTRVRRCWLQWTRVFTWHRERSNLFEAAAQFAAAHRHQRHHRRGELWEAALGGSGGTQSDLVALLHGGPVAARRGKVVATPVGHRLALHRLFQVWKQRATRSLMARVAAWQHNQVVRRRVVDVVCARARMLVLRNHRRQNEARQAATASLVKKDDGENNNNDAEFAAPSSSSSAAASAERHRVLPPSMPQAPPSPAPPPPPRAPVRVLTPIAVRPELLKYKQNAAACVTHAAQMRRCFAHWHARWQSRAADRHCWQSLGAHVLQHWVHRLTRRRQDLAWKAVVLHRWVTATQHRRDAGFATRLHHCRLLHRVVQRWRGHLTLRCLQADHAQRLCLQRWRERAAVRRGLRVLRWRMLHRLLQKWHARAQTRIDTRAHLYVADTLFETGLQLGCVRRWRLRAAEHRRVRLAWEVFVQLRCERLCRECFSLWQRRTFGPTAAVLPRKARGGATASPAMSLLS